jgi:hypothetical protein
MKEQKRQERRKWKKSGSSKETRRRYIWSRIREIINMTKKQSELMEEAKKDKNRR